MRKAKQGILTLVLVISCMAGLATMGVASEMTTDVGVEFSGGDPIITEPTVEPTTPTLPQTAGSSTSPKQLAKLPQTGEQSFLKESRLVGLLLVLSVGMVMFNKRRCINSEKTLFDD